MRTALVCGAGGFSGTHMVNRLKREKIRVRGGNSDNRLIENMLGWRPTRPLMEGIENTYQRIEAQVRKSRS